MELAGPVLTLLLLEFGFGALRSPFCQTTARQVLTLLLLEFGFGVAEAYTAAQEELWVLTLLLLEFGFGVFGKKPRRNKILLS